MAPVIGDELVVGDQFCIRHVALDAFDVGIGIRAQRAGKRFCGRDHVAGKAAFCGRHDRDTGLAAVSAPTPGMRWL